MPERWERLSAEDYSYLLPDHWLLKEKNIWTMMHHAYVWRVVEIVKNSGAQRVIEVGCGDGWNCGQMVEAGLDVVGHLLASHGELPRGLSPRVLDRKSCISGGDVEVVVLQEVLLEVRGQALPGKTVEIALQSRLGLARDEGIVWKPVRTLQDRFSQFSVGYEIAIRSALLQGRERQLG